MPDNQEIFKDIISINATADSFEVVGDTHSTPKVTVKAGTNILSQLKSAINQAMRPILQPFIPSPSWVNYNGSLNGPVSTVSTDGVPLGGANVLSPTLSLFVVTEASVPKLRVGIIDPVTNVVTYGGEKDLPIAFNPPLIFQILPVGANRAVVIYFNDDQSVSRAFLAIVDEDNNLDFSAEIDVPLGFEMAQAYMLELSEPNKVIATRYGDGSDMRHIVIMVTGDTLTITGNALLSVGAMTGGNAEMAILSPTIAVVHYTSNTGDKWFKLNISGDTLSKETTRDGVFACGMKGINSTDFLMLSTPDGPGAGTAQVVNVDGSGVFDFTNDALEVDENGIYVGGANRNLCNINGVDYLANFNNTVSNVLNAIVLRVDGNTVTKGEFELVNVGSTDAAINTCNSLIDSNKVLLSFQNGTEVKTIVQSIV